MSVEIAWKQNILVTDFQLLKSLLVVLGFGSQAFVCGFNRQNINSVCEMDFFNFLWLIWVHYLPLPPTQKDRPPRPPQLPPGWGPNLGALHKTKLAPQIAIFLKLASQLGFDPKFNISQIQNLLTRSRSKNWTLEVQKFPKFRFFKFFDRGQISYDKTTTFRY